MKRALIFGTLLILAIAIYAGVSFVRAKRSKQQHAHAYQATVESYRSALTTGMSRRQVEESLRSRGVEFGGFPAYSEDSADADLVKIGEEKGGLGCGPGSVNVAVRFETGTNRRSSEDPADTVKGVTLFTIFLDCM
jgi:hypothetical protein